MGKMGTGSVAIANYVREHYPHIAQEAEAWQVEQAKLRTVRMREALRLTQIAHAKEQMAELAAKLASLEGTAELDMRIAVAAPENGRLAAVAIS